MNLTTVSAEAAKQTGLPIKSIEASLRICFEQVKNMAVGESLSIMHFGTFKKSVKPSRVARNPKTGTQVITDEKIVLKFKYTGK